MFRQDDLRQGYLPVHSPSQPIGPPTRCVALYKINRRSILKDLMTMGGVGLSSLPVETAMPSVGLRETCILSWKWDVRQETGASKNLALAVLLAIELRYKYLMLDKLALQQSLDPPQLLAEVHRFSKYYARLPVIAAYDLDRQSMAEWSQSLRRPWILSEIRNYVRNPTVVHYVGFRHTMDNPRNVCLADEMSDIRKRGLSSGILHYLSGTDFIHDYRDLVYVHSEFAPLLSRAATELSKSDFLAFCLLIIILYQLREKSLRLGAHEGVYWSFSENPFKFEARSAFGWVDPGNVITFKDRPIACLASKSHPYDFPQIYHLAYFEMAEENMMSGLNITESAWTNSDDKIITRTENLLIPSTDPKPIIEEYVWSSRKARFETGFPRPEAYTTQLSLDVYAKQLRPQKWFRLRLFKGLSKRPFNGPFRAPSSFE